MSVVLQLLLASGIWGNTTDLIAPKGQCVVLALQPASGGGVSTLRAPRIVIDHDKQTLEFYSRQAGWLMDSWVLQKSLSLGGLRYAHAIGRCPTEEATDPAATCVDIPRSALSQLRAEFRTADDKIYVAVHNGTSMYLSQLIVSVQPASGQPYSVKAEWVPWESLPAARQAAASPKTSGRHPTWLDAYDDPWAELARKPFVIRQPGPAPVAPVAPLTVGAFSAQLLSSGPATLTVIGARGCSRPDPARGCVP